MSASYTELHAALAETVKRGAKHATLSMSEELALNATLRRLAAMLTDGPTVEDWQQLAGYAEWAAKRPPEPTGSLANATVHGQWIDWHGGPCPVECMTRVDVRKRSGKVHEDVIAGAWDWDKYLDGSDIVAYRIVD